MRARVSGMRWDDKVGSGLNIQREDFWVVVVVVVDELPMDAYDGMLL